MKNETHIANRRAAWRWGSLVVALLGMQVVGGIVAIIVATSDESVAVVPDYHQKALDWDASVRLRAQSEALGWACKIEPITESGATSGLKIQLADRNGNPIEAVEGEIQIFRHARASQLRRVKIPPVRFHGVSLSECFDADGRWQVTLDITDREGNRFLESQELYVIRGSVREKSERPVVPLSDGAP